jgi:hypothetical protein
MKKDAIYAVKYGSGHYNDSDFTIIGNSEKYSEWLSDGSLKNGDEIYEIKLIGKIVEKRELELLKTK